MSDHFNVYEVSNFAGMLAAEQSAVGDAIRERQQQISSVAAALPRYGRQFYNADYRGSGRYVPARGKDPHILFKSPFVHEPVFSAGAVALNNTITANAIGPATAWVTGWSLNPAGHYNGCYIAFYVDVRDSEENISAQAVQVRFTMTFEGVTLPVPYQR